MDIFSEIGHAPVRTHPNVWISRLAIFSAVTLKEQTIIRDISLSQGMNVIWAKPTDSTDDQLDIAGHSAGKTTFCRFIRYVLGEKTFSNKLITSSINKEFPEGYVAAEIHVRGKKWAIRRPIGDRRLSYIRSDSTIEELLTENGESVSQEEYTERLGLNTILDSMETSQVVQTSEAILWEHILAWCSRDQESRFQSLHGWRNPQSDSGTPSFQSRKTSPLSVIRTLLGLYLPEELKNEEIIADMKRRKENLEKQFERYKAEPEFRIALYERHLKDSLKAFFPEIADIETLPFDGQGDLFKKNLSSLVAEARGKIELDISQKENEQDRVEEEILTIRAQIQELDDQKLQIGALYEFDKLGNKEVNYELTERQIQRKKYTENKDRKCPFGLILVKDCPVVNEKQQIIQMTEIQDAHFMKQSEASRAEFIEKIKNEIADIEKQLSDRSDELNELKSSQKSIQKGLYSVRRNRDELNRMLQERKRWSNWQEKPEEYHDLHKTRNSLDELNDEILVIEDNLEELLKVHNTNREILSSIFRNIVRSVLHDSRFDGDVRLDGGEISFSINRQGRVGGEAVSTLSILLADMAALIFTIVSKQSQLPGFLMHDSPREADMARPVYHSYFRLWGLLQSFFQNPESCPFQYIITTTSEPPEEFRTAQYLKLELDASTPEGLLLKCAVDDKIENIFEQ